MLRTTDDHYAIQMNVQCTHNINRYLYVDCVHTCSHWLLATLHSFSAYWLSISKYNIRILFVTRCEKIIFYAIVLVITLDNKSIVSMHLLFAYAFYFINGKFHFGFCANILKIYSFSPYIPLSLGTVFTGHRIFKLRI